jgi:hypothetical protein
MALYEELRDGIFAHDKATGWERRRTCLANWTDKGLARMKNITVGAQCIVDQAAKVKYVDTEAWDDPNYGITDAELARAYIRHCRRLALFQLGTYKGDMLKKCVPWRKAHLPALEAARAPLYYDGKAREGDWALMDLKACYPNLYVPVGLAPSFLLPNETYPNPSLGVSEVRFDRPGEWMEHKGPRTALVGICGLRGSITVLEHGSEVAKPVFNDCFSPSLVAWCLWCANAIAQDLIERFGFVTWATDGGICPATMATKAAAYVNGAWGLTLAVNAMDTGCVWHATSYQVGELATAQEERVPGLYHNQLLPLDVSWFRDRFRWARSIEAATERLRLLPAGVSTA